MIPPIPAWEHVHPLVVHLPIGSLMLAPVLLIAAMVARRSRMAMGVAAAMMIAAGTAGTMLAAATGEAAMNAVQVPATAVKVLERHEQLAEMARNVFLALTMVLALWLGVAGYYKERLPRAAWVVGQAVYLVMFGGGLLLLSNAGHEGGRLVHEFGVRAHLLGPQPTSHAAPAGTGATSRERHD